MEFALHFEELISNIHVKKNTWKRSDLNQVPSLWKRSDLNQVQSFVEKASLHIFSLIKTKDEEDSIDNSQEEVN